MEIRNYAAGDESGVQRLIGLATSELRETYRPNVSTGYRREDSDGVFKKMVVVVEREIVGVIEYELVKDECYLQGLAVSPQHRRRGLARKLIYTIARVASEAGAKKLVLATIEETGNTTVFARLGFEVKSRAISSRFESDRHAEVHEVHMELALP